MDAQEPNTPSVVEQVVAVPKRLMLANQKVLAETLRLVSQSREVMLLREVTNLLQELQRLEGQTTAGKPVRKRAAKHKPVTEPTPETTEPSGFFRRTGRNGSALPTTKEDDGHAERS